MTVVTEGCSGYMNTNHHLVPPLIFAKVLWEACHIALGQPFEFLQHLLPLVHRTKTLDPKHDLHLYLKGQPLAKRLVLRVHESLVFLMTAPSMKCGLSALFTFFIWFLDQWPTRARTFCPWPKKVYPWGVPPRVSFRSHSPHAMSLHQSAP